MADFVAVIRRAVDGLTNNTPEMRVKVYDKARSAVVRQLESMKPRPPESLFQRQLEKLEQAIAEVEAEHAEALPAEEGAQAAVSAAAPEPAAEPEPQPEPEPAVQEETSGAQEPDHEAEAGPAEAAPVETIPAAEDFNPPEQAAPRLSGYEDHDPWMESAPVQPEPEPPFQPEQEPAAPEAAFPAAPEPEFEPQPEQAAPEAAYEEPAYEEPVYEEPAYEERAGEEPAHEEAPVPAYGEEQVAHEAPALEPQEDEPYTEAAGHAPFEPAPAEPAPFEPAPDVFAAPEPAYEVAPPEQPDQAAEPAVFEPLAESEPVQPAVQSEPDWGWPSHGEIELPAAPAVSVEGNRSADSIIDDFDAYLEGRLPAQGQVSVTPEAGPVEKPEDSAWKDFEALIGYDGGTAGAAAAGAAAGTVAAAGRKAEAEAGPDETVDALPEDAEQKLSAEGAYPYRAVPKPRPSAAKIGLAALAVLLLAGGGYALWLNRDALTELFKGPSVPSGTPVVSTGNGASTPENGAAQTGAPAEKLADGAAGTKFTQRLMPDGREVDEGAAGGAAPSGEGQSVARQNVAPQPSAGGQAATQPVASGEKTYLYEEMLGQTTPTAIEGGVVWDMREEKDESGQPQAVVQGTVTVPGRNFTALVTFKRNTDPSLPASHLVEIVFSVPADFEGGAIESVQRISMKRTEQDRGNVLIAVPARITDDFHMIALNDFPDARATNLELLRSRDWIDIPVTYRNGRRALLTLEKGRTGTDAFNKAVSQWQQQETAAPKP